MPVHRLFFPLCLSHHTVALGNAALQKSKKRKASNLMASVTPRFSATSCSPRALLVRSSLLPGRLYPTAIILSAKKFTVRLLSTIFIGYVRFLSFMSSPCYSFTFHTLFLQSAFSSLQTGKLSHGTKKHG